MKPEHFRGGHGSGPQQHLSRIVSKLGQELVEHTLERIQKPSFFFPPVDAANEDGMLAWGGTLDAQILVEGYCRGIFPWYDESDPILWWSPDPRAILQLEHLRITKSLQRSMKKFTYSLNKAFGQVIHFCGPAREASGTWLNPEMVAAYQHLHDLGLAWSFETWFEGRLVGGLYGVAINGFFAGESMFSLKPDASKAALVQLVEWMKSRGMSLLDCQFMTEHLARMGATQIPRELYLELLKNALMVHRTPGKSKPVKT